MRWWQGIRRAVSGAHILPVPIPHAAMAPKLAQPMVTMSQAARILFLRMTFGIALENLITCSPFTLIALAWLLSVCCMSQQLERNVFMCRSDWILPPPDHPVWWERRPERSRSPPPRPAPRTPPGPPPPTPPAETGLMMPMTPPELLQDTCKLM